MKIKKSIINQMIAHSKSLTPIESCGYLAGSQGVITEFYPMTNIDNSPEHFSFDPAEQFKVVKSARKDGLTLMSVYHSHPESPARLSQEDLRLLNDPRMVYIIVSLKDAKPDIKAFKIKKENEDDIHVEKVDYEVIT
jgi:[CysO sulfur-carrier protein]-S-L-cysteine hydrolase